MERTTMSEPIWNRFLTEQDKAVFAASGYGTRQGFGQRPAVLVVDVSYNFCGDKREPILQSIERWCNSCGEAAWDGIEVLKTLLPVARAQGLPVIYTTGGFRKDGWDAGSWRWKQARFDRSFEGPPSNLDGDEIIPDIAPEPRDIVIGKLKPSAFHDTPLGSLLTLLGADSLIVTGATTSGCVRATVVDAFSRNYKVALVEEACFDRSQASHALSLCDMHAKYADVVTLPAALGFITSLQPGLFALPPGT
jgi:nicotinamidase-related amidase